MTTITVVALVALWPVAARYAYKHRQRHDQISTELTDLRRALSRIQHPSSQ